MILVGLLAQTDFGKVGWFKIFQMYDRYDGANKLQIQWTIQNQEIRNKKFSEGNKENSKNWVEFAWIYTLERKKKTRGWIQ